MTLTPKQRLLLHRLLHRDLRKCSTPVLEASRRLGWSSGPGGGHELTALGRRIAEFSEQAPPGRPLEIAPT